MPVSIEEFWSLAQQSSLWAFGEYQDIQRRAATASVIDDAQTLANWLVQQKSITKYQAKVLLSGKPGPFIFGDYRVKERLASPSHVRRFKGIHLPTHHEVLLHFRRAESSQDELDSAKRHLSVQHPQLDRCYEIVTVGSFEIAITEDIDGSSLRAILKSNKRIPAGIAVRIAHQIAMGLTQLHNSQLTHGCISPADIIIQPGNVARLRRFPLQPLLPGLELPPDRLPEANYWAPELYAHRQNPDPLTDIYALGCVLYELLASKPPFGGTTFAEKMDLHASEPIRPFDDIRGMPDGLGEVVAFMMAKQRPLRYQAAAEIADKLEGYLKQSSQSAAPTPKPSETSYLSWLQGQRERIPAHLVDDGEPSQKDQPAINSPAPMVGDDGNPVGVPQLVSSSRSVISNRPRKKTVPSGLILGLALIAVAVTGTMIGIQLATSPSTPTASSDSGVGTTNPSQADSAPETSTPPDPDEESLNLVDDDGQTLWESPTKGENIAIEFTPPDAQMFLFLRPKAITQDPEGAKVLRALGPLYDSIQRGFQELRLPWDQLDSMLVALSPQDIGPPRVTISGVFDSESARHDFLSSVTASASDGGQRWQAGSTHVGFAPDADPRRICISTADDLQQILEIRGDPPLLKRQVEKLRQLSDQDRHVTLLLDPHFLNADGREALAGPYEKIRLPIQDFLGEGIQAASLSLNLGESFYGELYLASTLDRAPKQLAEDCRSRLGQLPEQVNNYLGQITIDKFWQPVALRFPLMISFLYDQSRVGNVGDTALINFVMPPQAAHNLFLATQLAIEVPSGGTPGPAISSTNSEKPRLPQILAHTMNFEFPQQSLEFAIRDFGRAVNESLPEAVFKVEIVGEDLQLAGITRNQQIRNVSLTQKTVDEILTELVHRANPVRTESVSDQEQKLVWVVSSASESTGVTLLITTRTAAQENGYELPQQFLANPAQE